MDAASLKQKCEEQGLGEEFSGLALLAVKKRQAEIDLGNINQEFLAELAELLAEAKKRGIDCPENPTSSEIANLYA